MRYKLFLNYDRDSHYIVPEKHWPQAQAYSDLEIESSGFDEEDVHILMQQYWLDIDKPFYLEDLEK